MKIFLTLILILVPTFPVLSNEIDNKGLICDYYSENKKQITEYYWFEEGQVYKVWLDTKVLLIKKSTYPAYYKLTPEYIRFYKIFVILKNMEFTNKNNTILGACKFISSYKEIETLLKV